MQSSIIIGVNRTRVIVSSISLVLQEALILGIWRWGLPQFGIVLSLPVLVGIMLGWAVFAVTTFWVVTRAMQREAEIGLPSLVGAKGKALTELAPRGQVMVNGEIWTAETRDGFLSQGAEVYVLAEERMKLVVRGVKR